MPITHAFVSAKADVDDATQVRPSDWNADHDPAQWTVGANGDLEIAADTTNGAGDGQLILTTAELPDDTVDVLRIRQAAGLGGAQIHSIDSSGQVDYFVVGQNATGLHVETSVNVQTTEALLKVEDQGGGLGATSKWVAILGAYNAGGQGPALRFGLAGFKVSGLTAAPADADLSAGDMALWFDQTNGAAKLKIKGKSANGTVVTGEVALT